MIFSHVNANKRNKLERNYQVSRTIPDRSLTLRQLIDRHNSGGRVKSFDPVFLGESSVIPAHFERMSLVERAEFAKKLPDFIADSRGRLMTMRDARIKAEKEALAAQKRAEFEALKKEFEDDDNRRKGFETIGLE